MCACVFVCVKGSFGREVQMADVSVEKFMMPCLEIPGGSLVVGPALERGPYNNPHKLQSMCVKILYMKSVHTAQKE